MSDLLNESLGSKSGFARHIGVTPQRVSQLIGAGLPVEADGRINFRVAEAWYRENVDATRRAAPAHREPSSRARKDAADAEAAAIRAAQLAGRMIDRAETLRAVEGRGRFERDAWIGWVNRAAPELAQATGADLAATVATLDRLVREQLATLAETPLAIGGETVQR